MSIYPTTVTSFKFFSNNYALIVVWVPLTLSLTWASSFSSSHPLPFLRSIISLRRRICLHLVLLLLFLLSIEQEFVKQPFDLIKKSLTQYADVATFFGYTVFFTAALPAAPFFAWINTYIGKWLLNTESLFSENPLLSAPWNFWFIGKPVRTRHQGEEVLSRIFLLEFTSQHPICIE